VLIIVAVAMMVDVGLVASRGRGGCDGHGNSGGKCCACALDPFATLELNIGEEGTKILRS
jgi:hypothetical protein